MAATLKMISIRELKIDIPKEARALAEKMLSDLEKSKRPVLEAIKTSLDNAFYNSKVGYLTPGTVYKVEVNAVGSAGPSDWSQPVSQMVV